MLSQCPQWKLVALFLWVGHLSMTWFVSGVIRVTPHPARREPFLTLSVREGALLCEFQERDLPTGNTTPL